MLDILALTFMFSPAFFCNLDHLIMAECIWSTLLLLSFSHIFLSSISMGLLSNMWKLPGAVDLSTLCQNCSWGLTQVTVFGMCRWICNCSKIKSKCNVQCRPIWCRWWPPAGIRFWEERWFLPWPVSCNACWILSSQWSTCIKFTVQCSSSTELFTFDQGAIFWFYIAK